MALHDVPGPPAMARMRWYGTQVSGTPWKRALSYSMRAIPLSRLSARPAREKQNVLDERRERVPRDRRVCPDGVVKTGGARAARERRAGAFSFGLLKRDSRESHVNSREMS